MIEMFPVDSSNIQSIGYDTDSETLQVEFNGGSLYQYFDVPEHIYENFLQADSQGVFLHTHIKGQYRYSRV